MIAIRKLVQLSILFAVGASACGSGGDDDGVESSASYRGSYAVPVPPELEAAAHFDVAEVEWSVKDGVAKLDYDLPEGLVGKPVHLRFEGPISENGETASLEGDAGSATCAIASHEITCAETMPGLLPLDPDYEAIESIAEAEYSGPAQDRVEVAKRFSADPIGIISIDLDAAGD